MYQNKTARGEPQDLINYSKLFTYVIMLPIM